MIGGARSRWREMKVYASRFVIVQVVVRIDFLVRDIRRHVNEVARTGFRHEFEPLTPPHAGAPAYHVNDALTGP